MVDDATGVTLALLDTGETTQILLITLKKWIEKYGIPKAVYVDLKSVYVSPKKMKEKYDDDLLLNDGFSVFEQVCQRLGIDIIKAYSPQAKGRVERKHRVFQDRFVKELTLYGIKTIAEANEYLEKTFLNKINAKFAKAPERDTDSHRDPLLYGDLNEIICWTYKRQVKNDWSIQWQRRYYQVNKENTYLPKAGAFIVVKKYLDNTLGLWHEGQPLKYSYLPRKPIPPSRLEKLAHIKEGHAYPRSIITSRNQHRSSSLSL